MTKELQPGTPEGEDKLNEIVDSYFDNPNQKEAGPEYSPEEIGGFKPIGTYSDGSPRYYGDPEENSHLPEYNVLERNFTNSIKDNDPDSFNHFSEFVRADEQHVKLIEQLKQDGVKVHPGIEQAVKNDIRRSEAEAGKYDNIPVRNLTSKYNYLDRDLKGVSGHVELRIQQRNTNGKRGQDPFEINIYQKNQKVTFLGTVPTNTGKEHIDNYFGDLKKVNYNNLTKSEQLSKSILNNDFKKVGELLKVGVTPQKNHMKLMREMEEKKQPLRREIKQAIQNNLLSKEQNKGRSI